MLSNFQLVVSTGSLHPYNTVWHYRWVCVLETGADLEAELRYVQEMAADKPKNYQV